MNKYNYLFYIINLKKYNSIKYNTRCIMLKCIKQNI